MLGEEVLILIGENKVLCELERVLVTGEEVL